MKDGPHYLSCCIGFGCHVGIIIQNMLHNIIVIIGEPVGCCLKFCERSVRVLCDYRAFICTGFSDVCTGIAMYSPDNMRRFTVTIGVDKRTPERRKFLSVLYPFRSPHRRVHGRKLVGIARHHCHHVDIRIVGGGGVY